MSARYSSPESRWTVSVGDLDPPDQPARPVPGGMSDYASLASAPPPQRPADGAPAPDGGAPAGGADAAPRAAWLPGLSPPARTNQTGPFVPASVPVPAGDMPVGLPAPAQPPVFDVVAGPGHAPAIAPPAPVDVLVDVRVDGPAAPLPPAPAALVPPPATPAPATAPTTPPPATPGPPSDALDLSQFPMAAALLARFAGQPAAGGTAAAGQVPAQAAGLPWPASPAPAGAPGAGSSVATAAAGGEPAEPAPVTPVPPAGPVPPAATGPVPLPPYQGQRRPSRAELAARMAAVEEQVDFARAEIALARAAFRRACEEEPPGWPWRGTPLDMLRLPGVARALARELAGIERLRVWAQELYWLQEQARGF